MRDKQCFDDDVDLCILELHCLQISDDLANIRQIQRVQAHLTHTLSRGDKNHTWTRGSSTITTPTPRATASILACFLKAPSTDSLRLLRPRDGLENNQIVNQFVEGTVATPLLARCRGLVHPIPTRLKSQPQPLRTSLQRCLLQSARSTTNLGFERLCKTLMPARW